MSFLDKIAGPLGKEYCQLYYWLTIAAFFLFVLSLAAAISSLFVKMGNGTKTVAWVSVIQMGFIYLIQRIQYSICARAL